MKQTIALRDGQIKGDIKKSPEDFVVKEILFDKIVCDEVHKYQNSNNSKNNDSMMFLLKLRNWDQFKAISYIASNLGIGKTCISFAGTKDKMAVTSQMISISDDCGVSYKDIEKCRIKDMEIKYLGKGNKIKLGGLWGNRFKIRVYFDESDLRPVRQMFSSIDKDDMYFPNYFGPQRFGTNRPISHIIGRHLINDDVESAVMSYLGDSVSNENKEIQKARKLVVSGDLGGALHAFPDIMHYEKIMISHLLKKKGDFIGAFKMFPFSMRLMFVHAYQSFLFNDVLTSLIENDDYDKEMMIPIFGHGLKIIKDIRVRKAMQEALRSEKLDLNKFRINSMPRLSSKGGIRRGFEKVENFDFHISEDGYIDLSFDLKKGCYATVFLREFFII